MDTIGPPKQSTPPPYDPRAEYLRRLDGRSAEAKRMSRADDRLANSRLAVFAAGLALAGASLYGHVIHPLWLAAPAALILALVVVHSRVLQRKSRAEAAVTFYERALERLDGRWAGRGRSGLEFAPEEHLYANDLDIFGEGSLFELLSSARTRTGEATLAQWLCEPAEPEEIRRRQSAVEELRHKLDLREDLALHGTEVRMAVRPRTLEAWAQAPPALATDPWRPLGILISALTVGSIVLGLYSGAGLPFGVMLIALLVYSSLSKKAVNAVDSAAQEPGRELNVLQAVLHRLEREPFQSEKLRELQGVLTEGVAPASRRIARLDRLLDLMEARHNFMFGPVAFVLTWGVQFALAIENWRRRWGVHVPDWLRAVGELEALSSLAAYAYEHPADPFPDVEADGPSFDAEDLGHPLLPEASCVRNDVKLGKELHLLVVSGSNMSGKSTLLRTVGVNAVLAQAGAPVRARRLQLTPLTVAATLRVLDSIRRGTSRFYAEILRLKEMMDAAKGPRPLLFLLDEILHGTNSHDRRVGAVAVVRSLVESGAIGLVTTHDLAVTDVAETLQPLARNVHFTDHLEDGRLVFDYRLRPGVVSEGNALRLMRTMGLPV